MLPKCTTELRKVITPSGTVYDCHYLLRAQKEACAQRKQEAQIGVNIEPTLLAERWNGVADKL